MSDHRSAKAEETVAILQRAALGGVPVLIPGAREMRAGSQAARRDNVTAQPATAPARASAADDRERLEHEREGGGAPSERTGWRPRTFLAKLRESVLHPGDLSLIWRGPIHPQR